MLNGPARCIAWMALWGLACFPLGRLIKRLGPDWDRPPFSEWRWEDGGRAYEKVGIRAWKDIVPDISKVFSRIVPKKAISGRPDAAALRDMLRETCVAEVVHALLCVVGLGLLRMWPGPCGIVATAVYIILGNVPFIMIQRYNRPRFRRLLAAAEARERRQADARTDSFEQ